MSIFDEYLRFNVSSDSVKSGYPILVIDYFDKKHLNSCPKYTSLSKNLDSDLFYNGNLQDSTKNTTSNQVLSQIDDDFFLKYAKDHILRNISFSNDIFITACLNTRPNPPYENLLSNNIENGTDTSTNDGKIKSYTLFGSDFSLIYLDPNFWPIFGNSNNVSYYALFVDLVKSLNLVVSNALPDNQKDNAVTNKYLKDLYVVSNNLDNCLFVKNLSSSFIKDIFSYYISDEKADVTTDEKESSTLKYKLLRANDSLPDFENLIGFSFSPCGFFVPYHLGVMSYLTEQNVMNFLTPLSGASSGSLSTAASSIYSGFPEIMANVEAIMSEYTKNDPDTNGKNRVAANLKKGINKWKIQNLDEVVNFVLPPIMSENCHQLLNLRPTSVSAHYSVLKGLGFRPAFSSYFESKSDLISCLRISSFIPFLSSKSYLRYKGELCFDGQLSLIKNAGCPSVPSKRQVRINPYNLSAPEINKQFIFNDFITPHLREHDTVIKYYLLLKSFMGRVNLLLLNMFSDSNTLKNNPDDLTNNDVNQDLKLEGNRQKFNDVISKLILKYENIVSMFTQSGRDIRMLNDFIMAKTRHLNNFANKRTTKTQDFGPFSPNQERISLLKLFYIAVYYELALDCNKMNSSLFSITQKYSNMLKKFWKLFNNGNSNSLNVGNLESLNQTRKNKLQNIKNQLENDLKNILPLYGATKVLKKPILSSPISLGLYLNLLRLQGVITNSDSTEAHDNFYDQDTDNHLFSNFVNELILKGRNEDPLSPTNKATKLIKRDYKLNDEEYSNLSNFCLSNSRQFMSYGRNLLRLLLLLTPPTALIYNYCNYPTLINYDLTRDLYDLSLNSDKKEVLRFLFDFGKADAFRWMIFEYMRFESYLVIKMVITFALEVINRLDGNQPQVFERPNATQNVPIDIQNYQDLDSAKIPNGVDHHNLDENDSPKDRYKSRDLIHNFLSLIDHSKLNSQCSSNSPNFKLFIKRNKLLRTVILDNSIDHYFLHILSHSHFWVFTKNYKP